MTDLEVLELFKKSWLYKKYITIKKHPLNEEGKLYIEQLLEIPISSIEDFKI